MSPGNSKKQYTLNIADMCVPLKSTCIYIYVYKHWCMYMYLYARIDLMCIYMSTGISKKQYAFNRGCLRVIWFDIHMYAPSLQHTATHCNVCESFSMTYICMLPRCNTLQHTATHCNTLQHTAMSAYHLAWHTNVCSLAATHCNTLQHTAMSAYHLAWHAYVCIYVCPYIWLYINFTNVHIHEYGQFAVQVSNRGYLCMGWLVSLAEYCLFYRALLQKRHVI